MFSLILCLLLVDYISGQCTDSLSKNNPIIINDNKGKPIYTAKSCSKLFKSFPGTCEDKVVGGKNGRCCQTCGDTKCLDKVTKNSPLTLDGSKITSCSTVVKNYKSLCKELGGKRGSCCRACKTVDIKCVDKLKFFIINNQRLSCAQYVDRDPCVCAEKSVKKDCCESCKSLDPVDCSCRDTLSMATPAQITINGPKKVIIKKAITSCDEIVTYYAQFCKDLGKKNGACCESCQGVDTKCQDNLLWKGYAKFGKTTCNNCNCHQMRKKGRMFMKKVCNSLPRAKTMCCLQCSRV